MSTRLVSNNSAYWPIYSLNTNCIDFTVGIKIPYEITPPQVIRPMPISHELQLARGKYFHRCVPLVDAVMWIHLLIVLKTLTCNVFITRWWNFTHFPGTSSCCLFIILFYAYVVYIVTLLILFRIWNWIIWLLFSRSASFSVFCFFLFLSGFVLYPFCLAK